MGKLADFFRPKVDPKADKIDAAMSVAETKTDELTAAVNRLETLVRRNIATAIDHEFEENARLTGRKRR